MLVQALAEYADAYLVDELNDAAWEIKPVPWLLEISGRGSFLSVVPRVTTVRRGKKEFQVPMDLAVPRSPVNRNSGHHPLLAADDISYVIGVGPWTPDKTADREKAEKHHAAFVGLLARAAAETGDPALLAVERFYADPGAVALAREALRTAKPGALVALSLEGPLVERPAVRSYWRRHYQSAFEVRMGSQTGECLISGKIGPIAPTHEGIKGLGALGGHPSGVALMSFNKEAFRSYGWDQNQNSPVSPDRALAYVLALNNLLRSHDAGSPKGGRRRDIAGIGFLSWLRTPEEVDPFDFIDAANADQVKALLDFDPSATVDENRFHLLGVSANGGRLRVRYWVTESLGLVKRNLQNWHRQLRLTCPWEESSPVRFWQLLYAIHKEGKPPAHDTIALLRRGIEGPRQPLGYEMLAAVLNGLRHPAENPAAPKDKAGDPRSLVRLRVPVGLLRMCLNDLRRVKSKQGDSEMSEGLDSACTIPAYVCGRLMAEFENLQRTASEVELNSSVLDRYFGLASTYPAVAFPKIEMLAQKHLRKVRRDKPAAAYAIDARLQALHGLLTPEAGVAFPAKLGLEEQGMFVLGYYHQKASSFTQAKERKQAKEDSASTKEMEN